ncbi:MAG: hypothetical protein JRC69_06025 [Deltaproteobacteria bacterium]|nr:hypothetical protein [Deltaproteobacteria bacterium]
MLLQLRRLLFPALFFLILSSCSSSEDQEKQTGIEQTTEKIAQEAIDYIKTPIDQAKMAKELSESHNRMVEDAVKQQQ